MATRQEWAARIQQWRRSGQTARDFARAHGFNHNTLMHWSWRLGAQSQSDAPRRAPRRRTRSSQPTFVEILAQPVAEGCFELELAGGKRLRIPPRFEAKSLTLLLQVLEQQR